MQRRSPGRLRDQDRNLTAGNSIPVPSAHEMMTPNYRRLPIAELNHFSSLSPPYQIEAVRSSGEYRAERDIFRQFGQARSQELLLKNPANTGDFCRCGFGERVCGGVTGGGKGTEIQRSLSASHSFCQDEICAQFGSCVRIHMLTSARPLRRATVPSPSGFYFETEISTIGVAGELLMDAALIVLGR
jgi:hypothetical protein